MVKSVYPSYIVFFIPYRMYDPKGQKQASQGNPWSCIKRYVALDKNRLYAGSIPKQALVCYLCNHSNIAEKGSAVGRSGKSGGRKYIPFFP